MKTNISKSIKHSLLVEADELGSLVEFIRSRYEKVRITAECKDNSELEADDISEIINFDNPTYRKIQKITINANTAYEETLRLHIDAASNSNMFFSSARLHITSKSDETAVYLSQEIPTRLREMKPEYDLLARFAFSFLIGLLLVSWMIIDFIGKLFGFIQLKPEQPSSLSWNDTITFGFILLLLSITLALSLDKIQSTLFPRVFFLIGKQKRSMENLKKWRMIVLTALILGVVSSLIASFIWQWLQMRT